MNWSRIIIKNKLSELDTVLNRLHKFSKDEKLDDKTTFNLHLTLDELLNNIISYGYNTSSGSEHFIEVGLSRSEDHVNLEIQDDSDEWDITKYASPDISVPLDEKEIGGLGVHLVKNLVEDIRYDRKDGKNILTLKITTLEKK